MADQVKESCKSCNSNRNVKARHFNLGVHGDAFGGTMLCDSCYMDAVYDDLLD